MSDWTFIIIIVLIVAIYSIIRSHYFDKKLKTKSENRGPISKDEFINVLVAKGYEKEWIDKLYVRVEIYVPKKSFTMSPDDSLVTDYRIHEPDILDIVNELYEERNGRRATEEEYIMAEKIGATIYTFEGILKYITRKFYQ